MTRTRLDTMKAVSKNDDLEGVMGQWKKPRDETFMTQDLESDDFITQSALEMSESDPRQSMRIQKVREAKQKIEQETSEYQKEVQKVQDEIKEYKEEIRRQ